MGLPQGVVSLRAWKPPIPGVREVLHATFGAHAYPRHTHDTWTLFIVDDGAIRYDLGRREGAARPSMVSILPPHVVHDGRPGTTDGYTKRVVYLELDVIGEKLIGPAADRPILPDPGLWKDVAALHDSLACIDDAFEAEIRLNAVADRIQRVLSGQTAAPPRTSDRRLAEQLRASLDERLFERLTMATAAPQLAPTRRALPAHSSTRSASRRTPTSLAGGSRRRGIEFSTASGSRTSPPRPASSTRPT